MKRNLILPFLTCGACLVLGPALQAQDNTTAPAATTTGTDAGPGGGEHHHGPRPGLDAILKRLTTELSLSDDQQAKIKAILEDRRAKMQAIHEDTSMTREDKMAKVKGLIETSNSQIKDDLNPDQQTKFEAMIEKMRNRRHENGGGPGEKGGNAPATTGTAPQ